MVVDSNEDEKLMYAKIDDKIKLSKTRNKILNTDFLYEEQIAKVEKYLRSIKHQNYLYFGGYLNASRKVLIIYPEKLTEEIVKKNLNAIFSAIRIELPNELKGTYSHKDFLGGIMKLGIAREKIGDIITVDNGADIIILKENEEYIYENLKLLTRFRKSNISVIDIVDIVVKETEFENFSVIVSSMRIDNFISELAKTSRNKAEELIEFDRVLLNYETVAKASKVVKENDVITIRGKGKFIIGKTLRTTKGNKLVIDVKKYI